MQLRQRARIGRSNANESKLTRYKIRQISTVSFIAFIKLLKPRVTLWCQSADKCCLLAELWINQPNTMAELASSDE